MDKPDQARKFHRAPVPRAGGLAIFLSLMISVLVVCLLPAVVSHPLRINPARAGAIVGLGGLMMLIGFWDDLRNLLPWQKFAAQTLVALAAWCLGLRILGSWSTHGSMFELGILSLPVTLLWIVGITNAFNLIDGIDGLSAGASLFAMLAMIAVSALNSQWLSVLL